MVCRISDNASLPQSEDQGIDRNTTCMYLTDVTVLSEARNRMCSLVASRQPTHHQAPVLTPSTKGTLSLYIIAVSAYNDAQRQAGYI